jgi:SAM-dependent methyltransferase
VPGGGDVNWSDEWTAAWKPHVDNPWFRYQNDVYADWWSDRAPAAGMGDRPRVLKTDAFEEACGLRVLEGTLARERLTLMDISQLILRDAARTRTLQSPPTPSCSTDVRRMGFRSHAFDLVFSPSTLDHFADVGEIAIALREVHRVLRPGGRLLISLDNAANPILRLRQVLHRRMGSVGGVIPFPMGRTLSRARLADALEDAGFEVLGSRYVLHAPRIVGLWLGEWAARTGSERVGRGLRALFNALERVLRRLPTRSWTAYFVAVDCTRRPGRDG